MNISMILVHQYMVFFLLFKLHQIIFIHYKSRIATAIRDLYWMKMTMVNSGLKGLMLVQHWINVSCLLGNDPFQKQSRDVDPMSVHCWADVGNGGPKESQH